MLGLASIQPGLRDVFALRRARALSGQRTTELDRTASLGRPTRAAITRNSAKESELVVANTVNTMPEKILLAFAEHGEVEGDKVTGMAPEAQQVLDAVSGVGISYQEVVAALERLTASRSS